jgi:hypothetical protein
MRVVAVSKMVEYLVVFFRCESGRFERKNFAIPFKIRVGTFDRWIYI